MSWKYLLLFCGLLFHSFASALWYIQWGSFWRNDTNIADYLCLKGCKTVFIGLPTSDSLCSFSTLLLSPDDWLLGTEALWLPSWVKSPGDAPRRPAGLRVGCTSTKDDSSWQVALLSPGLLAGSPSCTLRPCTFRCSDGSLLPLAHRHWTMHVSFS